MEDSVTPSNLAAVEERVRAYLEPGGGSPEGAAFSPAIVASFHCFLQCVPDSDIWEISQPVQREGQIMAITQAFNEVMADHKLNLIGYDKYDAESIGCVDDDLMRDFYDAPPFPVLEFLQSSDRVMTFK